MEEIKIPRTVREALIENERVTEHFEFSDGNVYLTERRLLCERDKDIFPLRFSRITSTREQSERNWNRAKWGIIFILAGIVIIVLMGQIEGAFGLYQGAKPKLILLVISAISAIGRLAGSVGLCLGLVLLVVGLIKRSYLTIFQVLPYGMPVEPLRAAGVMLKGKDKETVTSIRLKASEKQADMFLDSLRPFIKDGRVGQANCIMVGTEGKLQRGRIGIVETSIVKGRGKMIATGLMGPTMEESTKAVVTYARSRVERYGIDEDFAMKNDIHIHVPEAVPKEGPSAGISITCALISVLTSKPIARDMAMTGEITIKGDVLPIGGIEEKILAACEAGIKDMILPLDNQGEAEGFLNIDEWIKYYEKEIKKTEKSGHVAPEDLRATVEKYKNKRELIKSIKKKKLMNLHYVENLDQAMKIALGEEV